MKANDIYLSKETHDDLLVVEPKTRTATARPPLYKVLLLNDDYTPMDFVVFILKDIFHKAHEEAIRITLQVHNQGAGICGIFTRDVAETKMAYVADIARHNEHPLQCTIEKEE